MQSSDELFWRLAAPLETPRAAETRRYSARSVKTRYIGDSGMTLYLSNTATLLTGFPVASIPVPVTVSVLPSADTTAVCLIVGLPPFLY